MHKTSFPHREYVGVKTIKLLFRGCAGAADLRFFDRFWVVFRVPRPRDIANRVRGGREMQKNAFIAQIEPSEVVL